jgi:hypothetical protein
MDVNQVEQMLEQLGEADLTDEQMSRILTGDGEIAEGGTGDDRNSQNPEAKSEGEPAPATDEVKDEEGKAAGDKPVIMAKDGVHTIEYEKLVEARDEAKVAKEQNRVLQEQLSAIQSERDDLQAKMAEATKQDEAAGNTAATDELLASFKEDYPEFYAVLQRETTAASQALISRIEALEKMTGQIAPVIAKSQEDAAVSHFDTIRNGVEGYDQIVAQSEKVHAWIDSQPDLLRNAYAEIVANGSAKDVVAVLNTFKQATGFVVTPSEGGGKTVDVDAAIAAATQGGKRIPSSLSSLPSGSAAHHDETEAMLDESAVSLLTGRFANMTPEQINEAINRAL